jgi:DNA-binding LacI/PurR family transcriptional regulator
MAAEHLLARGRRQLAFFGNIDVPEFAARHAGFEQALAAAGAGPGALVPLHLTSDVSFSEIKHYLADNPAPDGIVAASDVIAMSAMRALAACGRRVPQDVGVVGYDDVLLAMHTTPPLTTIRQEVTQGAELMVDMLFRRMEGKEVTSVTMPPELVLRASA